jgi:ribosomal protein S24E
MTVPTKTVGERQRARLAKLERDHALARERAEGDAERLAKIDREYGLKRTHAEEEHRNDKAAAERKRPKS